MGGHNTLALPPREAKVFCKVLETKTRPAVSQTCGFLFLFFLLWFRSGHLPKGCSDAEDRRGGVRGSSSVIQAPRGPPPPETRAPRAIRTAATWRRLAPSSWLSLEGRAANLAGLRAAGTGPGSPGKAACRMFGGCS